MTTQRCHTTILFADLTSSTRIGESLDPELVAELLAKLRQVAEDVIGRHGGVVNQFYGDGVLAAFGFPHPDENDVVHAINAALELHQAVGSILPLPGIDIPGFTLQLHSGIHAGLVAVQEGDRIQGRYKLTGDALNTAARLSDAAQPGELLVSAGTIESVLPYFDTVHIAPLRVKGKSQTLDAYRVLGCTGVRTRYEASVKRGLSEFVGRQEEQDLLTRDLADVRQNGARYFELCGDPGVGKTRLCEEFIASLRTQPIDIFRAYCESGDSSKPLQPFIQVLRALFGLDSGSAPSDIAARIRTRIQASGTTLAEFEEDYLRLLAPGETSSGSVDGAALAQRSIGAVIALIQQSAAQKAVLLYLDDWHLADDLSVKTLVTLLKDAAHLPLFTLTAGRIPLDEIRYFKGRNLTLKPLAPVESSQLAAQLFRHPLDRAFATTLHRQSGGNPLFIEELCQSYRQRLDARHNPNGVDNVPITLTGLISARLRRLPDDLRALVNTAAVLGNMFDLWLFEAMQSAAISEDTLGALAVHDVIYPSGTPGTLRFKHGLTREVAYETLALKERKALHTRASALLEQQVQAQGGEEYFELLAYHFNGAEDRLKTGLYAELAGDKALSTMALDRAAEHYRRALNALNPTLCPGSSYPRWKSLILKFGWVSVFDPLPDHLAVFQRGLVLARQHQDQEALAKTEHWLAYGHYALGHSREAIAHCENAIAAAENLGAKALLVETMALLGQAKGAGAEYDDALALLDKALQAKSKHKNSNRPSVGSAYSLACKAAVLGDRGFFPQAYDCFESALNTLQGTGHQVEGSIRGLYSAVALWQGNWLLARAQAEQAQSVAQRISSSYMFGMYIALAGYASWMLQDDDQAMARILSTTHSLEMRGKMLFVSLNYGWAAEILVHRERWPLARKYAARALVRARQDDRLGEAMAYRALSLLAEHMQSPEYKRYLEQADRSAQIRQSRHELAKNTLHRAQLAHRLHQPDKAAQLLEQSLEHFHAMDMHWHAQQANRLLQDFAVSA